MKKLVSVLLTLALLLGSVSALAAYNDHTDYVDWPIVKDGEKLTVSVATKRSEQYGKDPDQQWFWIWSETYSGIDFDQYDAALSEILAQLKAVQDGDFTDEELEAARRGVAAELRTYLDNEGDLEQYWLIRNLRGERMDPMALAERVSTVTRADVIRAAAGLVCDAVYFLRGNGEESEEDEA